MRALVPVAAALVVCATAVSATTAAPSCSAAELAPAKPIAGLPVPVAGMRLVLDAAARRCDYAALERLADRVGKGVRFSFGGDRSATAYWKRLERTGPRPKPMEALVKLLKLPYTRDEAGNYAWPSAHRLKPSKRDWDALIGLYTRKQVDGMKRSGSYLGYRIGITSRGDWQYFVAGD